jgi:hypothetical protein
MNRAERRRDMRRVSKGENVVVIPTGERIRVDDVTFADMPVKRPGAHRWMAIATFSLTNPGAAGPKLMDQNNLVYIAIGCYDCEEPWTEERQEQTCPAPGED